MTNKLNKGLKIVENSGVMIGVTRDNFQFYLKIENNKAAEQKLPNDLANI